MASMTAIEVRNPSTRAWHSGFPGRVDASVREVGEASDRDAPRPLKPGVRSSGRLPTRGSHRPTSSTSMPTALARRPMTKPRPRHSSRHSAIALPKPSRLFTQPSSSFETATHRSSWPRAARRAARIRTESRSHRSAAPSSANRSPPKSSSSGC